MGPVVLTAKLRKAGRGERPALVVGQMQLQIADLVHAAQLEHRPDRLDRVVLPGHVEHRRAVVGVRPVLDPHRRQVQALLVAGDGLEQRRRALGDRAVVEARHHRAIAHHQRVGAVGRADEFTIAYRAERLVGLHSGSVRKTMSPWLPWPVTTCGAMPAAVASSPARISANGRNSGEAAAIRVFGVNRIRPGCNATALGQGMRFRPGYFCEGSETSAADAENEARHPRQTSRQTRFMTRSIEEVKSMRVCQSAAGSGECQLHDPHVLAAWVKEIERLHTASATTTVSHVRRHVGEGD